MLPRLLGDVVPSAGGCYCGYPAFSACPSRKLFPIEWTAFAHRVSKAAEELQEEQAGAETGVL